MITNMYKLLGKKRFMHFGCISDDSRQSRQT